MNDDKHKALRARIDALLADLTPEEADAARRIIRERARRRLDILAAARATKPKKPPNPD